MQKKIKLKKGPILPPWSDSIITPIINRIYELFLIGMERAKLGNEAANHMRPDTKKENILDFKALASLQNCEQMPLRL